MHQSVPTIHLNGTSRERLFEPLIEALNALRTATEKVAATAPNGRDYYPQGEGAIDDALRQHRRRMQDLEAIQRELTEIAEAVDDGGHKMA